MLFRPILKGEILALGTFPFVGSRTWLWFSMWILQYYQFILLFGIRGLYWRHAHLLYLHWVHRQEGLTSYFSCHHALRAYPNVYWWDLSFDSLDHRRHAAHLLRMREWISVCILFQHISGGGGMENQLYKLVERSLWDGDGDWRCSLLLHQVMDHRLYLCVHHSSNHHLGCCDANHRKDSDGYVCLVVRGLNRWKTKKNCQHK